MKANEGMLQVGSKPQQFAVRGVQPHCIFRNFTEPVHNPANGGCIGQTSLPWVKVSNGRIK